MNKSRTTVAVHGHVVERLPLTTASGRTRSDKSLIEYTERPSSLATKAVTEISAFVADPFRGHCRHSVDLHRPRFIRRSTARSRHGLPQN